MPQPCAPPPHRGPAPNPAATRRAAVPVLVVLGVLTGLVTPGGGPAGADLPPPVEGPTGTVSGTVVDAADQPVADVEVVVVSDDGWAGTQGFTAADGTYTLTVPAGNLAVEFIPPPGSTLAPQYWDASYGAPTPLPVHPDEHVAGIDAHLAVGATVAGHVEGPGGVPLEGATVMVEPWWDSPGYSWEATVGADGAYLVTGLPPAHLSVAFGPPDSSFGATLVGEHWDDRPNRATADLVTTTLGSPVTGVDAELATGGAIEGTVAAPDGFPMPGVPVSASAGWGEDSAFALTGPDGTYRLEGLRAGTYAVGFHPDNPALGTEYYDDAPTPTTATPVEVAAGATTAGIDARIDWTGSLNGRVVGADGRAAWAEVVVTDLAGTPVGFGTTNAAGFWTVRNLARGPFQVVATDEGSTQWWDHVWRPGDAAAVSVPPDSTVEGIDFALTHLSWGSGWANGTRVLAQCAAGDPATFTFTVDTFDPTGGVTGGSIDPGDGSPPLVFDEAADTSVHTFTLTGDPEADAREVTVTLTGVGGVSDTRTVVPGWTRCASPVVPTFTDVGVDHPFFAEIEALADLAITGGYPDGTFRPASVLTRQAAVAWLWRLLGEPAPLSPPGFSDVPADHPFADAISWAQEAGLTGGYGDGTFRPGATVTRQAMVAWMWRLAGEPEPNDPPFFADVPAGHPFDAAIAWADEADLVEGYPDGTFRPAAPVTRQAAAAWLVRMTGSVPGGADVELPVP